MATYTHGHHASVLSSHTWRTAHNSAAFLLPHLRAGLKVLDIGCGPGTITCDFADLVKGKEGHVIGLDMSDDVVSKARDLASERGVSNVEFTTGDLYDLPYADGSFDVVHAHQVLQHISDQVGALKAMRRVVKPGGIIAVREADFGSWAWYPDPARALHDDFMATYKQVARRNGGEPDAGRMLLHWALDAGFKRDELTPSASTWCYATATERDWWAGLWAERIVKSGLATTAKQHAIADDAKLEAMASAWREWGSNEDAWFAMINGEIICQC